MTSQMTAANTVPATLVPAPDPQYRLNCCTLCKHVKQHHIQDSLQSNCGS